MSGEGSTLFSKLHVDSEGTPAFKRFCLLSHVLGVVWTILQSTEQRENERKEKKKSIWLERNEG